ncbi:NUDIX domain-containing protein [Micromonospora haikouensis]|uniref:NUDIX domain-containing protein n=1 Tax=Micromonospora haikouensis TaxID=686309 RepID=UPI003D758654
MRLELSCQVTPTLLGQAILRIRALRLGGRLVAISDSDISSALSAYIARYPDDAVSLSEPLRLLAEGAGFASRRNFSMHVTVGALLVCGTDVLLVDHLAYGIPLQPGGHLEATDSTLISAALRELVEERPGLTPGGSSLRRRSRFTSSTGRFRHGPRRTSRNTSISTSATRS